MRIRSLAVTTRAARVRGWGPRTPAADSVGRMSGGTAVHGSDPGIHFGTGGWREIIGDRFTRANVERIVQALCDRMRDEGVSGRGVVIGYDRRFLSAETAEWATEVFLGNGVPVRLIDRPAPTPMFMWTVGNLDTAYGLAVTASHNPALYNGIKIFTAGGRDAEVAVTDDIEIGRAHV